MKSQSLRPNNLAIIDFDKDLTDKDFHPFLILQSLCKLRKIGQNHSPSPKLLPTLAESSWWLPFFQELIVRLTLDFILLIFAYSKMIQTNQITPF